MAQLSESLVRDAIRIIDEKQKLHLTINEVRQALYAWLHLHGHWSPEEPSAPQMWYCQNCKSGNRVDFHHTSCPACGKLRPAEKATAVRAPEVCGCPYGQCHCDDGSADNGTRDEPGR